MVLLRCAMLGQRTPAKVEIPAGNKCIFSSKCPILSINDSSLVKIKIPHFSSGEEKCGMNRVICIQSGLCFQHGFSAVLQDVVQCSGSRYKLNFWELGFC